MKSAFLTADVPAVPEPTYHHCLRLRQQGRVDEVAGNMTSASWMRMSASVRGKSLKQGGKRGQTQRSCVTSLCASREVIVNPEVKMATAYERFKLHATPDKFCIEACDDGASDVLVIDRASMEMTLTGFTPDALPDATPLILNECVMNFPPSGVTRPICGIMGTVRLVAAGKMDKRKNLIEFDKGQIVMARPLDQSISKTAALVGCSQFAVVSIYQKWRKDGTVVNRRQGHGQPRLIDDPTDELLLLKLLKKLMLVLIESLMDEFGVVLAGMHLIVITRKKKVGDLFGHAVWKAMEFDLIPYKKTILHLTETQMQDNKTFLSMINNVLNTDGFYFCTDYDLTHTQQRLANTSPDFQEMSLLERADQRFVWNGNLLRDFAAQPEELPAYSCHMRHCRAPGGTQDPLHQRRLHKFTFPVIHGFIVMKPCCINGKIFEWILISRRSCFRAGVRYYVRGIDSEGHAANFVETEQIVQYNNSRASFVQTRGSMPFFWSQRPNLKYKPKPLISSTTTHGHGGFMVSMFASQLQGWGFDSRLRHLDGFQRHFDSQVLIYGKQVILNLVNQKGSELPLEQAFAKLANNMDNGIIKYIAFDFHKECSKMRWHRLQILVNAVAEMQDEFGYFLLNSDGKVVVEQSGTFRSNCMDCLDRTNVIQSLLARRSLQSQLQRMGVLNVGQKIEEQADFEKTYKNAWADNANACAKQYAGTGALKTDFTRTGKRTHWGLLMDGWNSMIRYYKNNFSDGFRQDSIDLFLGNYSVDESESLTPLQVQKDWKFLTLPVIMLVAFSMCILCLFMAGEAWTETFAYVVFWGTACTLTAAVILFNGKDFVDAPKLVQKEKMD
ncbi:hypothetical protein QTP70_019525 [Hemibagrus guttatus]|uniref:SAC domain-containing protein n=1 Tax=Hemibagrus guttatus TaxID=175788 RepID=A0AAE0PU91_9TELE|nr:hypothetical protein QTP70_019525 [Hemibagrus guttatus]